MKNYTAESIRNVGVFGHAGEGKTTLVEAILFDTGLVDRIGKVENGTTVSDFDPEEAKRGCSINMSVEPVEWKNTKINFIDAPGGYDFYGDVASAAFLADSALIVVGAVSGPVVGAEKAMAMCQAQAKPRMMVINQMDRENASFEKVMAAVNEKFGPNVVPIQLPIMEGSNFKGFVDIINMTAYLFDGKNLKETAIPGNLSDEAQTLYEKLTEAAAEADEELMEKYFEEMELPREDILFGLSKGVKEGTVTPVVCTSALNNAGVFTLLDNIVHYLPAAADAKLPAATNLAGDAVELTRDGKLVATVAKTINDQFGKYSIVKVHRGTLDINVAPYNVTAEKAEKPSAPFLIRGKKTIALDKLNAGDIGALAKLQYTATNDTLCEQSDIVKVAPIEFPKACIALAIAAKNKGEDDKVIAGLNRIREEDPTITIEKNIETGDVLLCGLGEKHIDVVCSKLKNK
ncbi:MAG: GTP-binding protein, partial [Clostridia bacterium]|nr:GTP-binding protein [Clostridia bacterium]